MRNYTQGYVAKDRASWRAVINWQDENGKQRRLTKSTGIKCYADDNRGKALAEAVLRDWRARLVEKEREAAGKKTGRDTSFEEYAASYIEHKARSGNVADVTVKGYRSHMRHIIGTPMGVSPIGELEPKVIAEWEHSLVDGMAPATASHTFVFAKQVCTYAQRMGDLASNPFDMVDAPRRRRKPVNSLTADGMRDLMAALGGFGDEPFAVAVKVAVMTGMRQGEVCALRWCDVDEDERVIHVRNALARVSGRFALARPKTESSVRDIPYGENLAEILRSRKRAMKRDRSELGLVWNDGLFVVGSPYEDERFYNPQVLGHDWRSFIRTTGLTGTQGAPPRFHDLRHSFATNAIAAGIDVKSVSAILGHSSAAMTLDIYADALASGKRAGMEQMDALLS